MGHGVVYLAPPAAAGWAAALAVALAVTLAVTAAAAVAGVPGAAVAAVAVAAHSDWAGRHSLPFSRKGNAPLRMLY
jgi:hypothetical protein